jgi:hypothetical protein
VYITGRNSDPTNCEDETDDDLPSIEELWDKISRKGISTGGYWNPEDALQDLEDPVLDGQATAGHSRYARWLSIAVAS